ncbi:helix-hairpin-helix domain-containing protein [Shewanella olleyana]|uniref:ComEA family DNA-binding protein n=1 Tax=Shewanella olleyana TaxID=135626 RepID=UPI00200D0F0D|nr:helix-hairpin-helix domain-containing protein [Shewanella olleyana]MCL1065429.1 helix-hairpin-helix domain-containing protein [Shewanella olleyana]
MKHPFLMGVIYACALSSVFTQSIQAKEIAAIDSKQPQAQMQSNSAKDTKQVKVNINKASTAELQQLKGIGESKAKAIVEYRTKNGKFSNLEQLSQVSGVGEKLIEKNANQISF